MAQELGVLTTAKDLVVAWLGQHKISVADSTGEKTGEYIGQVFKAVVRAVAEVERGGR